MVFLSAVGFIAMCWKGQDLGYKVQVDTCFSIVNHFYSEIGDNLLFANLCAAESVGTKHLALGEKQALWKRVFSYVRNFERRERIIVEKLKSVLCCHALRNLHNEGDGNKVWQKKSPLLNYEMRDAAYLKCNKLSVSNGFLLPYVYSSQGGSFTQYELYMYDFKRSYTLI